MDRASSAVDEGCCLLRRRGDLSGLGDDEDMVDCRLMNTISTGIVLYHPMTDE